MLSANLHRIIINQDNAVLNTKGWAQHLWFIGVGFRIIAGVIWNLWGSAYQLPRSWFLMNQNYPEQLISITQKSIRYPFSAVGKVLVFWWSSVIFCKFWPRFCINNFNTLQNRKHEKRLETDVPSLESSVFMRIIVAAFTFGDRCSTNWAIPLSVLLLRGEPRSLAGNMIPQTRGFVKRFSTQKRRFE